LSGIEPEAELVRRAVAGDSRAFAALCDRHRTRIWRVVASVARGADADDLAQEVVIRAYCAMKGYQAKAPFEAWLCRIAVNLAHDYQRSAWKRRVTLFDDAPGSDWSPDRAEGPSAEGEAERRELQRRVRQAVATLPDPQRVPIWLHFFEGFSLAEVARLENTSEGTVRSRVRAGLKRLSLSLDDLMPVPGGKHLDVEPKGCGV
jgi:RNA polymerase sigma-70 factor (ECF subfamily)